MTFLFTSLSLLFGREIGVRILYILNIGTLIFLLLFLFLFLSNIYGLMTPMMDESWWIFMIGDRISLELFTFETVFVKILGNVKVRVDGVGILMHK